MNIEILVVKTLESKEILWSEGIEESNTEVQIILPRKIFSEKDISLIKDDQTVFSSNIFDGDSEFINLGQMKAYVVENVSFSNFKIENMSRDITYDDFIFQNIDYNKAVGCIVAYHKDTKELLFAEGTEVDGYKFHQVSLPINKITDKELCDLQEIFPSSKTSKESIWLGDIEAKDYHTNLDNLFIGQVYLK
jgi:hypothetical protein